MRAIHAALLTLCLSGPALAQTAAPAAPPAPAAPAVASPEAAALAKQLVARMEPNPQQTIGQLAGAMVGMVRQMGITDPDHAQVIVHEALLPMLNEHIGGLMDRTADAYAQTLSVEDLKAIIAFYDTKAGHDLVAAQPMLAQLRLRGMTAWMGEMQPEMVQKIQAIAKQHGWDKNPG